MARRSDHPPSPRACSTSQREDLGRVAEAGEQPRQRTGPDVRHGEAGCRCHAVVPGLSLPVQPPLRAVHRHAMTPHPPPQPVSGVLDRLPRPGDQQDEQAHAVNGPLLDERGHVDGLVDPVPQPLGVEGRAEKLPGAVLDPDDERTALRRVREAGDLIRELRCRSQVVSRRKRSL